MSKHHNCWSTHVGHGSRVLFPNYNLLFSCGSCNELKQLRNSATTKRERARIEEKMRKHYNLVNAERKEMEARQHRAKTQPDRCLYLEMDSMDQDKTSVPRLLRYPKEFDENGRMKYHVTAVKVPSLNAVYEYVYTKNLQHDANTTVTILDQVLSQVKAARGSLPPILYLQLDNTCRENKNKTMFAYLSLLVKLGVFKRIYLGFLPVGHTHFGCDQVFSRHSSMLRRQNIVSGPQLVNILIQSYTPAPQIRLLMEAADVVKWFTGCLKRTFQGVTDGYQFLFELVGDKVYVRDKLWSVIPDYQEGAVLLEKVPEGLPLRAPQRHMFLSHPQRVTAELQEAELKRIHAEAEKNLAVLKKNIQVLAKSYTKEGKEADMEWWDRMLEYQENGCYQSFDPDGK